MCKYFRHGIRVFGISADGDYRILGSMRHEFKNNSIMCSPPILFLQDIVHISTKLRNRLLNLLIALMIGNKVASVSHLKMLLNLVPKDIHGLVYSDICPDDRQNFISMEKIMKPKVRDALARHIIGSEGTIEYLRICQEITSSLYENDLPPLVRLYRNWRSTFFIRAWRLFITQTDRLNVNNNFLTTNAYACIELNAQNLEKMIKLFRNEKLDEFFQPTIFNSQPCEQMFRKMRSMGTMNYTRTNFTLLELIHLVGRVELMDDIMNFKLADYNIHFPRNPIHKMKKNTHTLPSDESIEKTISEAMVAAVADAKRFGINVTNDEIKHCKLKDIEISLNTENDNSEDMYIDLGITSDGNDVLMHCRNLNDYSYNESVQKNSFVQVANESEKKPSEKLL